MLQVGWSIPFILTSLHRERLCFKGAYSLQWRKCSDHKCFFPRFESSRFSIVSVWAQFFVGVRHPCPEGVSLCSLCFLTLSYTVRVRLQLYKAMRCLQVFKSQNCFKIVTIVKILFKTYQIQLNIYLTSVSFFPHFRTEFNISIILYDHI